MSPRDPGILSTVQDELNRLGYVDQLLQLDYSFDDVSSVSTRDLLVPVATFAQWPPSYRNACIGVLTANSNAGPEHVSTYRSLGAPMFFEVFQDRIDRYKIVASDHAVFLESISASHITRAFELNRESWKPDAIFRAKAIAPLKGAVQLDFVDVGLLPALKGMIHRKLDRLLKDVLFEAVTTYKMNTHGTNPDETSLFRLVFRCLAAKIFKDKRHSGNWTASDAKTIINEIQRFYGLDRLGSGHVLEDPPTQQIVWNKFRNAFNFQNISVDDLAFIYENTLIRKETRKQFGIHSTPPVIAELMVDRLPLESLPEQNRHVLEPCAGHGIFLVAALRRLRELLPMSWTNQEKHAYLKERLTAIEMDAFAAEVCRLSLTLADYPNPNGWKILSEDIFSTDVLESQLKRGQIVLCNPPFENFTPAERDRYGELLQNVHKPYEILRKILTHPPAMFGFVLPKSAIVGRRYQDLQDRIARSYENIETISLPDRVFAFSDQETVLLLASGRNDSAQANVLTRTFWVRDHDRQSLLETGQLQGEVIRVVTRSVAERPTRIWNPPLFELWDYLEGYPVLEDMAEIHRGIEWNISLEDNRGLLVSPFQEQGFKKGLDTAQDKIEPYLIKGIVYLNVDERYRRTTAHHFPWDKPKVVANSRRMSRSPWRIVGCPDSEGLVCYKNFFGIWPKTEVNIEVLSAIINSPLVNAALFSKGYGRDNPVDVLEQIAVPFAVNIEIEKVADLVQQYCALRLQLDQTFHKEAVIQKCVTILYKIDALILRAYDLPPKLERGLLEFFRGYHRPLPFEFPDYYPADFKPYLPFYKFVETDLKQVSAGELLKKITALDSEDIHEFVISLEQR
jgi:hypothetical protein